MSKYLKTIKLIIDWVLGCVEHSLSLMVHFDVMKDFASYCINSNTKHLQRDVSIFSLKFLKIKYLELLK